MCSNIALVKIGQDYINPASIAAVKSKNENKKEHTKECCDIILNGGQSIECDNYSSERIVNILRKNCKDNKVDLYA